MEDSFFDVVNNDKYHFQQELMVSKMVTKIFRCIAIFFCFTMRLLFVNE